jgi:GxxExxY protein
MTAPLRLKTCGAGRAGEMVMAALVGDERVNHVTSQVIGAAIRIHRAWGPGLLERAYLVCLCQELRVAGLQFELERPLPLTYLGVTLDCSYRADLIVEGIVLVELKAIDVFAPVHTRQLVTYTKLAGCRMGLLLNFGAPTMKEGIRRVVNGWS